ncbi:tRNA methyltransferase complex GCD14 subunit [Mollisia scopiformis]|uniref:tRNA (adenine(58)-N(1))-methyltransferase catalytic subunit TRM61 n=1 Tax=Mollisia scopiformis TaxID=149040 RepID=A0A194XCE6_MOLSC|nr:tRNA methyltransferase complex GCD14 subunit [Mollisia scopiformis]KUJ17831.1 tRNA methyltransferase complex GCD14 subunit [Mollisia scopiformis]
MSTKISPFLFPGPVSSIDSLSIIHLKRDLQIPTILKEHDEDDEGYAEGKVVNTRFGSFPHTTLIGLSWGSQVRASKVDTGSRGRRVKGQEKKRKREESESVEPSKEPKLDNDEAAGDASTPATTKEESEAVAASSGFIHLLPPTPENWTSSLPHRTQVVYTPDYSYILHRIRARPGANIIEAGAGSGSFTHASARAVFSGYPNNGEANGSAPRKGKVWSFEFHEQRHEKLEKELQDHGLEGIVQVTHRDVCEDGFLVDGRSPGADAVFLDLPAPWLALPHLSRSRPTKEACLNVTADESIPFISPLNPSTPVHICTFSPCIEQVQRTISVMRHLGWVDIEMVELSQKRFEIRRERIGIDNGAQRGVQGTPATVEEAYARLVEVEGTFKAFHETGEKVGSSRRDKANPNNRDKIMESLTERKVYKEGRLVHRTEPEIKAHTSYLVFAILPREWSEEDERKAREKWEVKIRIEDEEKTDERGEKKMGKKAKRRAERQAQKDKAAAETEAGRKEGNIDDTTKVDVEDAIE